MPIPATGESQDQPIAAAVRETEAVVQIGAAFLDLAGSSAAASTVAKARLLGVQFHNLGDRSADGYRLL